MNKRAYREEVKFRLSSGYLDIELDDKSVDTCIDMAFREVQRYITSTKVMTVPYQKCIDLKGKKVSSVTNVFRADSIGGANMNDASVTDPMAVS